MDVDAEDWNELRTQLCGQVLVPDDAEYPCAKQLFNPRYDSATPVAVVRAAVVGDVQAAVAFAAEHNLTIAPRCGGHSYIGASSPDGVMVVDVRGLAGVNYGSGHAVVGSGTPLHAVHTALDAHGQTIPAGTCSTVGIAGLTLGGGIGVESRRYGLTCDRLTAATMVLPTGDAVEVSATTHPDLFWAIRGGGGGNFGVVTSLTYRTCPATSKDIVRLNFPGTSTGRVISGWSNWLHTTDRDNWANINVMADGHGALNCAALIVCPAGTGDTIARTLTAAAAVNPLTRSLHTLTHMDAVVSLAGGSSTPRRESFVAGSDVVAELSDDVAGAIIETMTARSRAGRTGWVFIDPLDGAVGDCGADATSFPWRQHAATLQWYTDTPDSYDEATQWVSQAHRSLASSSVGAYVNYLEPSDTAARYYGHNLDRLSTIRRTYDPHRLMHSGLAL